MVIIGNISYEVEDIDTNDTFYIKHFKSHRFTTKVT